MNIRKLQHDFPILRREVHGKPLVYLDNAATTQKPRVVLQAMEHYYTHYNSNVHRGIHKLSEEATLAYENAHEKVARFIGADSMREVSFTRNCSDSLNLIARMLEPRIKKGDEIIVSQIEHHSNLVVWQQLAQRTKAKLKWLPYDKKTGKLQESKLSSLLSKKTKIFAITHASNVLGTIPDIAALTRTAHEQENVHVVLDMAQSVGHFPVDVKKLGVDWAAFSGHKMYGPTGIGVLYGKQHLLEKTEPVQFGGDMVRSVSFEKATWNELPWKFEPGTPPIAEGIGLGAAVDFLSKLGMENVQQHEQRLTHYALEHLSRMKKVDVYGPHAAHERVGVLAFNIEGAHAHDVGTILDMDGVAVRAGTHCAMPLMQLLGIPASARASFGVYNTEKDVDALITGIKKVEKIFN